ncbi:unnamed protein product, partial [Sphenostylis stenocarpa]
APKVPVKNNSTNRVFLPDFVELSETFKRLVPLSVLAKKEEYHNCSKQIND